MALWAAGSRCVGAFGVCGRAAAPRRYWDLGPGGEGLGSCGPAVEGWREVLSPHHPHSGTCPFPLPLAGLFTSCPAATRGCAFPTEPRGLSVGSTLLSGSEWSWERAGLDLSPSPRGPEVLPSSPRPVALWVLHSSLLAAAGRAARFMQPSEGRWLEERVGKVPFFQVSWKLILEVCSYLNERSYCYRRRKVKPKRLWLLLTRVKQDRIKGSTALEMTVEPSRYNCRKVSLKIENDSEIFCGITGFINFWLQYLLLVEKLIRIVRQCSRIMNSR